MIHIPPVGRAVVLSFIAAIVLLAATMLLIMIGFDLDRGDLGRLAGWLGIGAGFSLLVALFLAWVVDRAGDGSYWTRSTISGVLVAFVLVGTTIPALWKFDPLTIDRHLVWPIIGFATTIAIVFSIVVAWLDSNALRTTSAHALSIANGNYRARLPERGNTELVQFATAVNLLASRAQTAALQRSGQDHAREHLLLAIADDTKRPVDHLRAIAEAFGASTEISPETVQRYVAAIERETSVLQHHLGEIEEIVRLERGQITLRLQPISLARLTIAVCDRLQPGASTRNIAIAPRVDFSIAPVLVDPEQTFQALEALIGYALLETPDEAQLQIEMRDAGRFVQVAAIVTAGDEEPGIAARVRWESSHRRRASALSLAVATRLIEIQGGSLLIPRGDLESPLVVVSLPKS